MPSQSATNGEANGLVGEVRCIPLSYENKNCDPSARELILALRPEWSSPDSKLEFVRFTEGITNTLLKAVNRKEGLTKEEIDNDAILLRAYGHGTDVLIDRHRETQNHELLTKYGLAPELLARFNNGMMYRYIRGRVTQPADLRTLPVYRAVARRLAQWHARVPCIHETYAEKSGLNGITNGPHDAAATDHVAPGKPPPNVWTVMQKWILALPAKTDAERTRQADLQKELERLVGELSQRPGLGENGLVFAHCDLLSGNVIIEPKGPGTTAVDGGGGGGVTDGDNEELSVSFIDYEYATPSPAAFDLANHFAEWGGFDCDYNVLPTRAQRLEFIEAYIRTYYGLLPDAKVDLEAEVQRLHAEVDVFRGVPGFYWGIWALIQATISQIEFDYAKYAEVRLGEYWAWRDEVNDTRALAGREMPLREKRWAKAE
ncbi:Uu.00g014210.m01.CDS01 [Anthostomella pinea]|uniref:ethanolamine kinase n=1 Tax=Anthostomella pinea TaxID=933095 RepID=A0AAI8VYB9_9PEZI|nr:Uu.00g014210.m01.CDS01 [Anthostomella pinea]